MTKELSYEEKVRLHETMVASAREKAIANRAKGLFDHANFWEEQLHQLAQYDLVWPGRFPGLEGTVIEETMRFYGRPAK